MPSNQPESIERFEEDFTVRWSCRPGDMVIWFRAQNPFGSRSELPIRDIWETKAGDFVTITNRWDDLPSGFRLHPTEVANVLVDRWQLEFGSNWSAHEPIDAPNLWRGSGRVVVICQSRSSKSWT